MLKELFQAMSEQAVAAAKGPPVSVPVADPTRACWLVAGQPLWVELGTPPVQIEAFCLSDFARLADYKEVEEVYVEGSEAGIVVTGLIDAANEGRVLFRPGWSELFKIVAKLGKARLDQKDAVRLLAQDLRDAAPSELLSMLRSVDFNMSTTREISAVGRERGTREFAVQAAGELPETFLVTVAALEECGVADCRVQIRIGLDVSIPPASPGFLIRPLPGEIEAAMTGTCQLVRLALKAVADEDGLAWAERVYFGRPTAAPTRLAGR
jgi:hypothetical protein